MSQKFIEKILSDLASVKSHEWLKNGLLQIELTDGELHSVGFFWERNISLALIEPTLALKPSFIASVPSGAFWDGAAMMACEDASIGWGGVGTFRSACLDGELRTATEKSTKFARRIIRQHRNVDRLEYVNSLVMIAHTGRGEIRIAFCDDYDVSGDSVRSTRDKLGGFDVLFKNNPNGMITADAHEIAEELGAIIADAKSISKILRKP